MSLKRLTEGVFEDGISDSFLIQDFWSCIHTLLHCSEHRQFLSSLLSSLSLSLIFIMFLKRNRVYDSRICHHFCIASFSLIKWIRSECSKQRPWLFLMKGLNHKMTQKLSAYWERNSGIGSLWLLHLHHPLRTLQL